MEISIISMVLTAVLVLSSLFLVLAPFFKWDNYLSFAGEKQETITDKEALLTTLNEIEFEYKMGKLSEGDFKNLKKQYETEVSKILKSEDRSVKAKVNSSVMADVEKEIEAALKAKRGKKEAGK
ncbi:hypothetical protein [Bacillus sp. DNRA2]|uniref:hypothetical protein n=1 Tax=Bacillus sp. DNRA2 TaxID=2723053 RepID=UPI002006E444|nr:hypothetical protein [Bacillus sp. DNRA2]